MKLKEKIENKDECVRVIYQVKEIVRTMSKEMAIQKGKKHRENLNKLLDEQKPNP